MQNGKKIKRTSERKHITTTSDRTNQSEKKQNGKTERQIKTQKTERTSQSDKNQNEQIRTNKREIIATKI